MAIKTFKEILDNKGYRVDSNDRKIFENGDIQSFFGLGQNDSIEFIIYDINDNQLPQKDGNLVRYIPLTTDNIKDYFLIAEGTIFQKYQLPNEYFIDVERLLREGGYNNGNFKTQITLINKRVGSELNNDKLWISEISPSRTEVRLFPIRDANNINKDLEDRFSLFTKGGEFRDDTINSSFNFVEAITPTTINSFMKRKYSEKWLNKMIGEFKIKDFDTFITTIHNKFLEASIYEFTNRISDLKNINYGKPSNKKTKIELSKNEIIEISKKILVSTIEYYLTKQDIKTTTTFDSGINESMDEVGNVIQSLESNTTIDTSSPVVNVGESKTLTQTDIELELEKQIKIELPEEEPIDIKIVTPDDEPDYIPPAGGGGGYGGGGPIGNPEDGGLGRPNLGDGGMGRERMEYR
jgi:hypothetical protein